MGINVRYLPHGMFIKTPKRNKNVVNIKANISIIILHAKGLNTPIKNRDCQSGFKKKKAQLYVVYKKSTLNYKI